MLPTFVYNVLVLSLNLITCCVGFFFSDRPNTPWFTLSSLICNSTDRTYITVFTFNVNETGGSDINYYNGTVTGPSGFSSQFNVTNTAVITGLHCSTSYNINVAAVNCAGVSTVNSTSFTTPQPGECLLIITMSW